MERESIPMCTCLISPLLISILLLNRSLYETGAVFRDTGWSGFPRITLSLLLSTRIATEHHHTQTLHGFSGSEPESSCLHPCEPSPSSSPSPRSSLSSLSSSVAVIPALLLEGLRKRCQVTTSVICSSHSVDIVGIRVRSPLYFLLCFQVEPWCLWDLDQIFFTQVNWLVLYCLWRQDKGQKPYP